MNTVLDVAGDTPQLPTTTYSLSRNPIGGMSIGPARGAQVVRVAQVNGVCNAALT
jgi:hypothetical protein